MKFSKLLSLLLRTDFSLFGGNAPLLKSWDNSIFEDCGVGSCNLALALARRPRDVGFFLSP